MLSDESTFFFFCKFPSPSCISYVPELLLSPVAGPWCALMLHHTCLVSHPYCPKPKRAGENSKAALLSLPQQLSIQCLLMTWTWHPGWFMFVTTKAAKHTGWGHEKLKMVLQGLFRNVRLFTLNISSSVEYHCILRRNSKENMWKGVAHLCKVCVSS